MRFTFLICYFLVAVVCAQHTYIASGESLPDDS